jgi:GT2 family glycosyltransferase
VDHDSDDPATRAYLLELADSVRVLHYSGVFNFSAINNFAVSKLGLDYSHYLFCNNDIEAIEPGWLERMLELAQKPNIGIVGAMLFYPDRKHLQHAGVCVGMYGAAEHYGKWIQFPDDPVEPELMRVNREVSAVTAACMLVRADAFRGVEGFDEAIAVGFGDVDLCLRVGERGYRVVMSPHARLVHHESYTRGTSRVDPHPKDSALFRLKWKQLLRAGDPFYNPGYSNEHTHWPVKQPLHMALDVRRRIVKRDVATGETRVAISPPRES